MNRENFLEVIRNVFPEDLVGWDRFRVEKSQYLYSDAYTLWGTSRNAKGEVVSVILEYILVDKNRKIIRIDRSNGGTFSIKKVEKLNVYVDIVNKLTMEPVIRFKNPKSMELINGVFCIDPADNPVEVNTEAVDHSYDYKRIFVNPLQNHILIYCSYSNMSKKDIQKISFPVEAYKQGMTIFSPLAMFKIIKEVPKVQKFLSEKWNRPPSEYVIESLGYGQEGCIIKNEYTGENIVATVNLNQDPPKAIIILPNGEVFNGYLTDLCASKRGKILIANIHLASGMEGSHLITNRVAASFSYFSKDNQNRLVNIGGSTIDLQKGTTIVI